MKKRVLLVEDNPPTVDVLEMELKHLGYEVRVATNGLEAVKMVVSAPPDLVVMDILLPELDGLEATRRLRENPSTRDVPILAATAKAMPGDKEKCLAAGCDGYIAKPFNHRELETAIAGVFKLRLDKRHTNNE
ncbi:MAG: response regulator [Deltaproteobacteria bacterium]|nr:MAG: response regulator [Deltaproteobacteria bacterium]